MRKNMAPMVALLLSAISLTACAGSKTELNEKNVKAALDAYYDKHGLKCLLGIKLPQNIEYKHIDSKLGDGYQMQALEQAGVVKSVDAEWPGNFKGDVKKGKRYEIAEASKSFTVMYPGINLSDGKTVDQMRVCWGRMAVDKVVKWQTSNVMGQQATLVNYHYKMVNLAPWATHPAVLDAFSSVKEKIDGAGKTMQKHSLNLTNLGWEAVGIDAEWRP